MYYINTRSIVYFTVSFLIFITSSLQAQGKLFTLSGSKNRESFGTAVGSLGDINNDGVPDFLVGIPNKVKGSNQFAVGQVKVFSGKNQKALFTNDGDNAGDTFGSKVTGVGDINGPNGVPDGVPDYVVGIPGTERDGNQHGSIRAFSGADGSALFTVEGDAAQESFGASNFFGRALSQVGDVGGGAGGAKDGVPDFAVGSPFNDNKTTNAGNVKILSGKDGSVILNRNGERFSDSFGTAIAPLNRDYGNDAKTDPDGLVDFLVGSPSNSQTGVASRAEIISAADGTVLRRHEGDDPSDGFGRQVANIGDVTGDNIDDYAVGAPTDDNNGQSSGSVRVFSGVDGSTLYTIDGEGEKEKFGTSISGLGGDVNGDNVPDFIVGAPNEDELQAPAGKVRVVSGADGTEIHTFKGPSKNDRFGFSVTGPGDLNGDGFPDLLVGALRGDKGDPKLNFDEGLVIAYTVIGAGSDDDKGGGGNSGKLKIKARIPKGKAKLTCVATQGKKPLKKQAVTVEQGTEKNGEFTEFAAEKKTNAKGLAKFPLKEVEKASFVRCVTDGTESKAKKFKGKKKKKKN